MMTGEKNENAIFNLQCVTVMIAAQLLGISKGLCYRMAKEGVIPTVRIRRRLVVPVEALQKLLADGRGVIVCPDASERQQMVMAPCTAAKTDAGAPPSG